MKIDFDNSIKIAGIGLVPWTRLGPEQWLPNYAIVSYYGGIMSDAANMPKNYALGEFVHPLPKLAKFNTGHLLRNPDFQRLLEEKLAGYDLLTYRPVTVPDELKHRKFLLNDNKLAAKLENKVEFRRLFAGKINFPKYEIYDRSELESNEQTFEKILSGRQKIVIQDENLSGGKGTFIVDSFEEYIKAVSDLNSLSSHTRVVVSSAVKNSRERSIQCCIGSDGIYIGPLQRQIVRNPLLANMNTVKGDKFCGASIDSSDQSGKTFDDALQVAEIIGTELKGMGYRGIFGVDFLLDENDELFVLEINPRLTGVTPLLTSLFRKDEGIPFYLLHLLDLGGYEYSVIDESATFDKSGALLILHSLKDVAANFVKIPKTGTYSFDPKGKLTFVSNNVNLEAITQNQFVVKQFVPDGTVVKPGARQLSLEFCKPVLDNSDRLYNDIETTVRAVQSAMVTEAVNYG
ncbi:MAG TPA: ATP-grasp domain-containing protein [Candidatus Saccharimonadales bacterium]|nr:ATP-grasp domain-containing protein [Candidatus Saccharimonadales bacterium]